MCECTSRSMQRSQPLAVSCSSKHEMNCSHVAKLPRGSTPHIEYERESVPLLFVTPPYTYP